MTGMDYEETLQYFPFEIDLANEYSEKRFVFIPKKKNWTSKIRARESKKNSWKGVPFEPSNMLQISSNKLMDQTEIANINYQLFIAFVKADSAEGIHTKYLPTKNLEYYLDPEFYFYPVVGISNNQASAYCLWRSRIMNYYAAISDGIRFDPGTPLADSLVYNGGKTFLTGRLPTVHEWKKQAEQITIEEISLKVNSDIIEYFKNDRDEEYQLNYDILAKDRTIKLYNVNVLNPSGLKMSLPSYIYSFNPNPNGFYHLIGNVAEMMEDGSIVGGDFKTDPNSVFEIGSSNFSGFRCVCEVHSKN